MRSLILLSVVLLFPVLVSVAENDKPPSMYMCVADMATGFILKNNHWKPKQFDVSSKKYTLRRSTNNGTKDKPWIWTNFGSNESLVTCDSSPDKGQNIHCENIFDIIRFNVDSMKYQISSWGGYWLKEEHAFSSYTPYIEIGKCSTLWGSEP